MTTYEAHVTWKALSGLPEDVFVNTWHFYTASAVEGDYDNVRDLLKDFYCVAPVGLTVAAHMSNLLNKTAEVKLYNLDDEKPRVPVYTSSFTAVAMSGGSPLPAEVALCLSFEARKESGKPQARRRNRVYLGPFSATIAGSDSRPSPATCTAIHDAAARLKVAANASVSWEWVVYSPTDDVEHEVSHIWVDNAWDTQRRRGIGPTTRTQSTY